MKEEIVFIRDLLLCRGEDNVFIQYYSCILPKKIFLKTQRNNLFFSNSNSSLLKLSSDQKYSCVSKAACLIQEKLKLCIAFCFWFFSFSRLVGDVLLCTGFLSYCGPFNQNFRKLLLKDLWEAEMRAHKIPFSENLNLISMLVDLPTVSSWCLIGLILISINIFCAC